MPDRSLVATSNPVGSSAPSDIGSLGQRVLLVFHLADRIAALPVEDVERITPMAALARPPGLPSVLEGVLNLSGEAVPVLRLDRLFGLPIQRLVLYSTLVILRDGHHGRIAILVDRVNQILSVPRSALLPIDKEDSFNACAEATVLVRDDIIHVLSPSRILLEKERKALSEFQEIAQRRIQEWEAGQA